MVPTTNCPSWPLTCRSTLTSLLYALIRNTVGGLQSNAVGAILNACLDTLRARRQLRTPPNDNY